MSKETAYQEMLEQFKKKGKREWSFEEVAEIMNKHQGIPKEATEKILNQMAQEQKYRKGQLNEGAKQ